MESTGLLRMLVMPDSVIKMGDLNPCACRSKRRTKGNAAKVATIFPVMADVCGSLWVEGAAEANQ